MGCYSYRADQRVISSHPQLPKLCGWWQQIFSSSQTTKEFHYRWYIKKVYLQKGAFITNHLNPLGLTAEGLGPGCGSPSLGRACSLQGSAWDLHAKLEAQWSARGTETFQPIEEGPSA